MGKDAYYVENDEPEDTVAEVADNEDGETLAVLVAKGLMDEEE